MLSGFELLDTVDDRLRQAEQEAQAAEAEAEALERRREAVRTAQAEALRSLARLRARMLSDGGAALGRLEAAEQEVHALLEARRGAAAGAAAVLQERQAALAAAQEERDRRAEALRAAEAHQARAIAEAHRQAEGDAEFQRMRSAAEEAARIARHAEEKAALAAQDLASKGRPYMEDPLFAYLWRRGFGTAAYRADPFARMMDRWVARVAGYDTARKSYALLEELPASLAAHAARMREKAAAEEAALTARLRALAGLPVEDGLAAAREALDMAEAALHAAARAAEEARAALAGRQDSALGEATARMEQALAAESLQSLRAAALRTPTREDDEIVARLDAAAAEAARLDPALARARETARQARAQQQALAQMREEMRQRGYRRDDWDFGQGALVGALIGEFLRGVLSRDGFWDRMERHRMPRSGPWESSPWGSQPGRGGPWSDGGSLGGGPWSAPEPGGFGGGNFRTGGGFGGGGGFRTGGGF